VSGEAELEQLVDSLLYEGYALYPYTPGSTKNATPTPFGIVYPSVYAATLDTTHDYVELRCGLVAAPDAVLSASVRFLVSGAERHQAAARRVELAGAMVGALATDAAVKEARIEPEVGPPLRVALSLSLQTVGDGEYEVCFRVENRTVVSSGLDARVRWPGRCFRPTPWCGCAGAGSSRRWSVRIGP